MWAYETNSYQIYTLGFCGAPFENDYKPVLYDELGSGAVQSIDSLFTQDQHPLNPMPDKLIAYK